MATAGLYPFFGYPVPYDRWTPYTPAVQPSAGLIASAEDLSRYMIAYLNGGRYAGAQVLSAPGMQALHTPGVEIADKVGYAIGWVTFPFDKAAGEGEPVPAAVAHAGTWAGFAAYMILIPEKQVGVVILMNTVDPPRTSEFHDRGGTSR